MREVGFLRLALVVAALALTAAGTCSAQEQPTEPQTPPVGEAPAGERSAQETADGDPCGPVQPFNTSWFDWLHRKVYRSTCGSANWFDGFFGDERIEGEREGASGKLAAFAQWSEAEDWDLDGRFRVKFNLPHMDKRIEALAARWQEDEYVAGTGETTDPLPVAFSDLGDADWLLGLGYSPIRGDRQRLSFSAGVDLDTPVDPFAKADFRRHWFFPSEWMARWRQTLFWTDNVGVGTTSRLDLDRRVGPRLMLRNTVRGTFSDSTEGVDWYGGITLFQDILHGRALAYQTWIRGSTDAPVTVKDYGLKVRYRQRFLRDWLFAEASAGMTWVRPDRSLQRESSWGAGIGFEMLYGYRE